MRPKQMTEEQKAEISALLTGMGFRVNPSNCYLASVHSSSTGWLDVDLSATELTPKNILIKLVEEAYKDGKVDGEKDIQWHLRALLGVISETEVDDKIDSVRDWVREREVLSDE